MLNFVRFSNTCYFLYQFQSLYWANICQLVLLQKGEGRREGHGKRRIRKKRNKRREKMNPLNLAELACGLQLILEMLCSNVHSSCPPSTSLDLKC